jgi:hypothetical protein
VEMGRYGKTVTVEVLDESSSVPVLATSRNDPRSGRGLVIVDALASRWGYRPSQSGKSVWFTLFADC